MRLDDIKRVENQRKFMDIAKEHRGENTIFLSSRGYVLMNFCIRKYRGWDAYQGVTEHGSIVTVFASKWSGGSEMVMDDLHYISTENMCEEDKEKMQKMHFNFTLTAKKNRRKFIFRRDYEPELHNYLTPLVQT